MAAVGGEMWSDASACSARQIATGDEPAHAPLVGRETTVFTLSLASRMVRTIELRGLGSPVPGLVLPGSAYGEIALA